MFMKDFEVSGLCLSNTSKLSRSSTRFQNLPANCTLPWVQGGPELECILIKRKATRVGCVVRSGCLRLLDVFSDVFVVRSVQTMWPSGSSSQMFEQRLDLRRSAPKSFAASHHFAASFGQIHRIFKHILWNLTSQLLQPSLCSCVLSYLSCCSTLSNAENQYQLQGNSVAAQDHGFQFLEGRDLGKAWR